MLAKKSRHFIKPTADELGESEDLVDDLITFFYKKLKKDMSSLSVTEVRLKRIGSFSVTPRKLTLAMNNRIGKRENVKSDRVKEVLTEEVSRIKECLAKITKINQDRYQFKLEKKHNEKCKENTEE